MGNDLERGYGVIPLKQEGEDWLVLAVQRVEGFWEFPKGHALAKESPQEAAERELKEETGLLVAEFFNFFPLSMHYSYYKEERKIDKQVDYYIAKVKGDVKLQEGETIDYCWLPFEEIRKRLSFESSKNLFDLFLERYRRCL